MKKLIVVFAISPLFNSPVASNHYVEVYKNLVLIDLEQVKPRRGINQRHIKEGIESFETRKEIIIRPADKSVGVLILDREFYHQQMMDVLLDPETYRRLPKEPTLRYKEKINALIEFGYRTKVLTNKEKRYLIPSACRIPIIYTLPKIHKNVQCPVAHPIVNGIGLVMARLEEYLDKFLQPRVTATRAFLKDTKDYLRSIKDIKLQNQSPTYLVTEDVSSPYTIIQHKYTLQALNWAFSWREDIPHDQNVFLQESLDFCLSHNYFWYHNTCYSQKNGVAMGAKFAPSLANIFMVE